MNESNNVTYRAVCKSESCRGITAGTYKKREYAENDKRAHEKWHDNRDEDVNVEVEAVRGNIDV